MYLRNANGIIQWYSNAIETAANFAHDAAHTLGMFHDFDSPSDWPGRTFSPRNWTCGSAKTEGGGQIMNYGTPRQTTWSSCSNYDFKEYYEKIVQSNGKFCLN